MPRRKRQLQTWIVIGWLAAVVFAVGVVGGVAFEFGRYIARIETDSAGID